MNQILYTGGNKKSGQLEVKTIVRIFSIFIILFGLVLVGQGSFAIISSMSENNIENIPVVTMNQDKNTVLLTVKHDKAIDKIIYSWNKDQEYMLLGRGRTEIEEEIEVIEGINTLTVKITDIEGKNIKFKIYDNVIMANASKANVVYTKFAKDVTLDGECEDFSGKIPDRVLAYGVAMEYCFISSLFDEASIWENRYKNSLLVQSRNKHNAVMPKRRWL